MTLSRPYPHSTSTWVGAAAFGLLLAACGSSGSSSTTTAGQAVTEAPVAGTITLNDSSVPMQVRAAPVQVDGTYAVQVTGLTLPYLLRVEWTDAAGAHQLYAVSEDDTNLDVNGLTDAAYGSACAGQAEDHVFRDSDSDLKRGTATKARALLAKLMRGPLAPLFQRYGITDLRADRDAIRQLLLDVSVVRREGVVTVTNRATGGVIFVGPLGDLDSGTFTAANMPPGPAGATCTAFTYSAYAACRPDSTQIRTVLTSSPAGCTGGAPVTTQACTYVPPVTTCTAFTYSAYAACQPDNTQTRTVLTSSPAGCTGGAPVTTQACTYVPPVTTCTAFTYSAYAACRPDSTQIRTVLTSSPAGCTGGAPVTTQACTYVPPVTTCTAFTYSAYAACQPDSTQTRTVLTSSPAGCTGGAPVTTQACTYVPPVTTCTAFTYSAYGACQPNSTQTRAVLTSSPAGCTGGAPVTTQACTYVPPPDGSALYTQYCAGCHGNSKKGASVVNIQAAIAANVGGMGSAALRALTVAQLAAISAAP